MELFQIESNSRKKHMNLILFLLACGTKQADTSSEPTDTDTAENNESSQPITEPEHPSTDPSTEPSGEPVEPDTTSLNTVGGCSDYFVYAHNDTDTQTIHVIGAGLAQQAHEQGEALSISYSINPDTDDIQPTIRFQTGENLNHVSCNDAIIPGMEPVVTNEWTAISGTVSVTVTPNLSLIHI